MAVTRIAHGTADFNTSTVTLNMTGATLFIAVLSTINNPGSVTDSSSNTWTALNRVTNGARNTQMFYVIAPTTSATQIFTLHTGTSADSMVIVGLDPPSPVFDTQNVGASSGTTTLQPGSLTPGGATNLLITSLGGDADTSIAINPSFNIGESLLDVGGGHQGVAMAWLEQASATAQNPTWTIGSNGTVICSAQASFTFTGGGGGGSTNWGPWVVGGMTWNRLVQGR